MRGDKYNVQTSKGVTLQVKRDGLHRQIAVVKQALNMVAQMLSGQSHIRVVFRGTEACTNGNVVYLPELSLLERRNMNEEEVKAAQDFLEAIRGFLFHEVAHLLYTDMVLFRTWCDGLKASGDKHAALKKLTLNAVEDPRVETDMSRDWSGAGLSIGNMNEWALKKMQPEFPKQPVLGQAILGMAWVARTGMEHWFFRSMPASVQAIVQWMLPEVRDIKALPRGKVGTKAAIDLTERIVAKLARLIEEQDKKDEEERRKREEEKKQQQAQQGQPGQSGAQGEGEGEGGDSEDEGKPKKPSKKGGKGRSKREKRHADEDEGEAAEGGDSGDDPREEEDGDAGDEGGTEDPVDDDRDDDRGHGGGEEEEGGGDDEEDEGARSGGSSDDEEGDRGGADDEGGMGGPGSDDEDGDEPGDEGGSGGNGEGDDPVAPPALSQSERERIAKELEEDEETAAASGMGDPGKMLAGAFKEFASGDSDNYLILTTEHDVVETAKTSDDSGERYQKILDAIKGHVGVLKRGLSNVLRSKALSYDITELEDGELDTALLHRVVSGTSDRVFKQRVEDLSLKGIAVTLLVNLSGSMKTDARGVAHYGGITRLDLAQQTAVLFAEVLDALSIPFEIIGHSTAETTTWENASPEERNLYHRFGANRFIIYKAFEEQFRVVRHRLADLKDVRCTHDGEALQFAGQRLIRQNHGTNRRVIFTIDDGEPLPDSPHPDWIPHEWVRRAQEIHGRHQRYAKEMAENLTKAGVQVVGLGMASDSVLKVYKEAVVVREVTEFPVVALAQLRKLLLSGTRKAKP